MGMAFDKVRVLVVEDHEASVQIVRALLSAIGVKDIVTERTCATALARLDHDKVDIAILDRMLADEDGLDFLRAIRRQDSRHAFLPVLVLSAYTDKGRVESARDAGATEVCAKPVSPVEVYRRLMSMIVTPRPYVRSEGYFGPNRRRRGGDNYTGPERREVRESDPPQSAAEAA